MSNGISILIVRIAGTKGRAFDFFKTHHDLKEITQDDTTHRYATKGPCFSIFELTICKISVEDHINNLKVLCKFLKKIGDVV